MNSLDKLFLLDAYALIYLSLIHIFRMDDADMRLTEKAWKLGLAKEERYKLLTEKRCLLYTSPTDYCLCQKGRQ